MRLLLTSLYVLTCTLHGPLPTACGQLLLVRTAHAGATAGTLCLYEKSAAGWRQVGASIPVAVGRKGLAWGRGLHPDSLMQPPHNTLPCKHEGDGKSPQGIFALASLFGEAPQGALPFAPLLPYRCTTGGLLCVDDTASGGYNAITDSPAIRRQAASFEEMRRRDSLYLLGAVVAYNTGESTLAGDGSCIFLHVWRGPAKPTAGCTAMAYSDMLRVAAWLDAAKNPILAQLTEENYLHLRQEWHLGTGKK